MTVVPIPCIIGCVGLCPLQRFSSGLHKSYSLPTIFPCHHFHPLTPYSEVTSQIASPFNNRTVCSIRCAMHSLQQTFQFGSYDGLLLPLLKSVPFMSTEQTYFKIFSHLQVLCPLSHHRPRLLPLCYPTFTLPRDGVCSSPPGPGADCTKPCWSTGCGAWSPRKASGRAREHSRDEMGQEGGASGYEPVVEKPAKPDERATTKRRRQGLESAPKPKSLPTVTFHRGLAALAPAGRKILRIPVWSRHGMLTMQLCLLP